MSGEKPLTETGIDFSADDLMPPMPSPPAGGIGGSAVVGEMQLRAIIEALQSELDKKDALITEKHDLYLRAVAETENVRRRGEKEKEETAKYAITKFAKDVLSVGDNFQRAIAAVPADAAAADPALKSFLDGVSLAERDFQKALEKNGVRSIEPKGQPFNPHLHQAVMEQEDLSVPNGTVLQVFQTGYLIDDRCIRPAMVVVSRGGPRHVKITDEQAATPPQNGTD